MCTCRPLYFSLTNSARVSRRLWNRMGKRRAAGTYRRSGFCRHTQFVKLPRGTMNRVFSQQIFRCDGIQANVVAFLIPAARHVLLLVIYSWRLRVSPPSILFSRFVSRTCRSFSLSYIAASSRRCLLCSFANEAPFENQHSGDVRLFHAHIHVDRRDTGKSLCASFIFIYILRENDFHFVYVKSIAIDRKPFKPSLPIVWYIVRN